jgi:hypothetical protein
MPTTPSKNSKSKSAGASTQENRIIVENVNVPGYTTSLDATLYHAMRRALIEVLPSEEPGLTQTEMREAVISHLPEGLFPDGGKVGWWAKAVQLDLEAKRILIRENTKPLRWHQIPGD